MVRLSYHYERKCGILRQYGMHSLTHTLFVTCVWITVGCLFNDDQTLLLPQRKIILLYFLLPFATACLKHAYYVMSNHFIASFFMPLEFNLLNGSVKTWCFICGQRQCLVVWLHGKDNFSLPSVHAPTPLYIPKCQQTTEHTQK